jgi:hypothetical protein
LKHYDFPIGPLSIRLLRTKDFLAYLTMKKLVFCRINSIWSGVSTLWFSSDSTHSPERFFCFFNWINLKQEAPKNINYHLMLLKSEFSKKGDFLSFWWCLFYSTICRSSYPCLDMKSAQNNVQDLIDQKLIFANPNQKFNHQ